MKREPKKLRVAVVLTSVGSEEAVTCWREGMKKREKEGRTSGEEVEKVE